MTASELGIPHRFISNRSSPVRWIASHVRRHAWLVIVMFIGAFGNAALAAAVPVFIGKAFNTILADATNIAGLLNIAIWITISQLVRGVLQWGRNFGAELIGQRLERDIREELYVELLGKSMTFHNLQPIGDTMARATNDVHEISLMFSPGMNLVVGSANFLLLPLIVAPSYHPSLILVPALFIVGYAIALAQYLRELQPITSDARETFGVMNARLSEAIDGIEVVKGHAREDDEVMRFSANVRAFRDAFVRQGDVEARFLPLLLMGLAIGAGFAHAMLLYAQGILDVGQVVAYVGLLQLFGFPTFVSLFAYSQVSLGLAGARRILEIMNRKTELVQNPPGIRKSIQGRIAFRDLSFCYPGGAPCLEDINLEIEPGQTVALVGQTGAGKTTLIKMINRTYDPTSGAVLIDGTDVREWNLESLRRQISIIEQDVFLFSRTIAENIAFGRQDASLAEIEAAAKAAQAHDFIMRSENGYQAVVGERGVTLSGGQRQRVALARAFLTNPSILILDDSTSSIDSATEDEIQKAIFKAAEGRTTLIITHRLSQIRWADLIVVVKQGRIEAVGNHNELMGKSPAYRNIFSQFEDKAA